jgi:predicted  nucleic acid-binding Zn-ribbon protein
VNPRAELYRLQEIDIAWYRVRRRLLAIQKELNESEELKDIRQQVADTEAYLRDWQSQQRDAELEAQALAERIQSSEQRLMSGQVRNPKELTSLQASVEALHRQHGSVEDRSVEALLKVEQLQAQLAEQKERLSQVEQEWQSSQSTLVGEEQQRKRELLYLKQQRQKSVETLGPELVSRYERLRKRKNGVAVARLADDTCNACHMQVPTGVISTVHSSDTEIVLCPSCGRILYAG